MHTTTFIIQRNTSTTYINMRLCACLLCRCNVTAIHPSVAFNLTGALNFYTSGCINSTNCVTTTGTVLGVGYTVTQTCCSTDLCNGASSVRLPLTAAVGAALLATTWSFM
uniref:UPAR/Ly6 domain-containing protein n=1 Tax=Pygocentrus nattereri TaxID=42514 RepID=A0A3B4DY08_PYGNA